VFGADRISIRGNAISSNGGLGIDLDFAGVLPNDIGDGDTGSNQNQNYPVLTSAITSDAACLIQGTLSSATNATFSIDFYEGPPDPSGYGEGLDYVGTTVVSTGPDGTASFAAAFPQRIAINWVVSATATDTNNNTSEFSATVAVSRAPTNVTMFVSRAAGQPRLQWPSEALGFVLESTTTLQPPIQWQVVSNDILDNGTTRTFTVTNVSGTTNRYFRLRKQ
jgi:hypothetical protein